VAIELFAIHANGGGTWGIGLHAGSVTGAPSRNLPGRGISLGEPRWEPARPARHS
jgi:hypothetical protein